MTPEMLKLMREKLGLTQQEMADRLGVYINTYTNWEYGRRGGQGLRTPTLRMLERFAQDNGLGLEALRSEAEKREKEDDG